MTEEPEALTASVEAGVEMPASRHDTRATIYPFADMDVGDSFLIEFKTDVSSEVTRRRLYGAVAWANKRHKPMRFSQRTVVGGVRVWRTE